MNAPDRFIPRPAVTASEIAYETAEAEFLASPAKYAAWLESVDGDRRMTLYFHAAMTEGELMAVQMSTSATVQQVYEATRELRWRYLKDQCEYIAERSIELQEPGTGYNGIAQ